MPSRADSWHLNEHLLTWELALISLIGQTAMLVEAPRLLAGRYRLQTVRDTDVLSPPGAGDDGSAGDGGSAVTRWQAEDEVLGRSVVVTTVTAPSLGDSANLDRVRAETSAAVLLDHPYLENTISHGETHDPTGGSVLFAVAEPLGDDPTLAERLASGRLPWRMAVETCAQIAAGLSAAHAAGIAHHRLAPEHVVITPSGPKITNFGTAGMGSGQYLAPEQVANGRDALGTAADVYALGLLLYHALAGELPKTRATTDQTGTLNLSYASPPPVPGLPIEVISLCRRCLRMDPTDRPTSAEVARQLADTIRIQVPIVQPPLADPSQPAAPQPPPVANSRTGASKPLKVGSRAARNGPRIVIEGEIVTEPGSTTGRRTRRLTRPLLVALGAGIVVAVVAATGTVIAVVGRDQTRSQAATRPPVANANRSAAASASAGSSPAKPSPTGPACAVRTSIEAAWNTGTALHVTITNTGSTPFEGWALGFNLPAGITADQGWNGAWHQQGTSVTVRDIGFNSVLKPGEYIDDVGAKLVGQHRSQPPVATEFTLNGVPCQAS